MKKNGRKFLSIVTRCSRKKQKSVCGDPTGKQNALTGKVREHFGTHYLEKENKYGRF